MNLHRDLAIGCRRHKAGLHDWPIQPLCDYRTPNSITALSEYACMPPEDKTSPTSFRIAIKN